MRVFHPIIAAAALVPALAMAAPAAAQDVQYETVTKIDFPGALGTAMRLAARLGGGSMETVETTYIKGKRMRSDADKASTITDLENGRVISVDHEARTYWVMTFGEMMQMARQTGEELKAAGEQRTVSGEQTADTQLRFSFSVEDAKERDRIAGYNAQRFFLTMQAEGEYVPEGATEREQGGTLVVLTDLWSSKDMPAFGATQAFGEATAQEYAAATGSLMEGITAAFAGDPQLRVAFEKSAEEASKIDGMAVRTTVRFVTVAPGKQFDRALAIEGRKDAGPSVGQQVVRGGLGRLAARAAGQQQQQAEAPQQEELTQATIMTVTTEVRNVSTRSLDGKLFEPPAGYREVKPGAQ
jgi:hypothetical protein